MEQLSLYTSTLTDKTLPECNNIASDSHIVNTQHTNDVSQ